MKPNPDIALIYHYDLARALAGEVVDWQAIPVNVQAGREGGDLCRAAADFGKRRDLFAMPAPSVKTEEPCSDSTKKPSKSTVSSTPSSSSTNPAPTTPALKSISTSSATSNVPLSSTSPSIEESNRCDDDLFAVPVSPVTVEQPAVDPRPDTASPPAAVSAADRPIYVRERGKWDRLSMPQDRDRLILRIKELVDAGEASRLRQLWPEGVLTLKHDGHTPDELAQILAAVRRVEAEIGAGWHPDDGAEPHSAKAIRRAVDAWAGRDPGTAWFAASLIATFEQCRNADSTFEDLVASFTIEQCDRLHDAAQGITP